MSILLACAVISTVYLNENRTLIIESGSATFNQEIRTSTWNGNVVVTEHGTTLNADSVKAIFDDHQQPKLVTAVGNPVEASGRSKKGKVDVQGRLVIYDRDNAIAVIEKEAKISRTDEMMSAEKIIYDIRNKSLSANGGTEGKVHFVFPPKPSE